MRLSLAATHLSHRLRPRDPLLWTERGRRFTKMFEPIAIRLPQKAMVLGVVLLLKASLHEAEGLPQRTSKRGLARREQEPIRVLGIDEKSFHKRHEYVTPMVHLGDERVGR